MHDDTEEKKRRNSNLAMGIAIGIAIGAGIGTAMGNLAMGKSKG